MITIISGTNRPNSRTGLMSRYLYDSIGKFTDSEVNLFDLKDISPDFIHPEMYSKDSQHPELVQIQDALIIPANKLIMVVPEYNGSYSGIIKLFIDALSVRMKNESFKGKKLGLVGIASGRAGNLRGLDHLTTSLNYLGMNVFPNRLPISLIESQLENDDPIPFLKEVIDDFLLKFVAF